MTFSGSPRIKPALVLLFLLYNPTFCFYIAHVISYELFPMFHRLSPECGYLVNNALRHPQRSLFARITAMVSLMSSGAHALDSRLLSIPEIPESH